jgi:hypothetical protein
MGLVVGTNSWVTLTEANTYFSNKWNAGVWAGLTNTQKEQLLISAYNAIQACSDFSISPTSAAAKVKQAQCEMAWFIYKFEEESEHRQALYAQGVRQFSISSFSESLEESGLPANVKNLLGGFLIGNLFTVNREFEDNEG